MINKHTRQIEQSGKPGDHKDNMQRFYPEHRRIECLLGITVDTHLNHDHDQINPAK